MRIKVETLWLTWEETTQFGEAEPDYVLGNVEANGLVRTKRGTSVHFEAALGAEEIPLLQELLRRINGRVIADMQDEP